MTDDEANAAITPCSLLAERIERLRAQTFAGLRVKALAIAWCRDAQGVGIDRITEIAAFAPDEGLATDDRIAASIVRDLLAMRGLVA